MEALKYERNNYSYSEYLELENHSEFRHEFYFGEVFAMSGTSRRHNEIIFNMVRELKHILKGKKCFVYFEQIKVEIVAQNHYVYPDVVVSCSQNEDNPLCIKFPMLIIEVLSDSTCEYDRYEKFEAYKTLNTLKYYVLVEQKRCMLELFIRENEKWNRIIIYNLQSNFEIPELGVSIPLSLIYEGIEFDKIQEFHFNLK